MKKISTLIGVFVSLYLLAALLLFIFQRDFLYFPTGKVAHDFKVEQFSTGEVVLDVVVLNEGKPDGILYFGGNGESVAGNAPDFKEIFPQHTVYLVNYRGYGGSTGSPSEQGIYADAQYVYDAVAGRHRQISVIGRSLGTGVATLLAATRNIHKMALVTPYASIEAIAKEQYPAFPVSLLLKDKYDSASRISGIGALTLIILAEHDAIIPARHSSQLIKEFPPAQVSVETIQGAGHNNLSQDGRYYLLLQQFL